MLSRRFEVSLVDFGNLKPDVQFEYNQYNAVELLAATQAACRRPRQWKSVRRPAGLCGSQPDPG